MHLGHRPVDDDVIDSRVGTAARGDIEDGEGSTGSVERNQSLQIEDGVWSKLVMFKIFTLESE